MTKPQTIAKDTPFSEITLRKYEKPSDLSERELIRKLCLSFGLLQPGDSRDVIVDIFYVIHKEKKELTATLIEELVKQLRKENNVPLVGVASSNIRRQLKRLRNLFLIEKVNNNYRMTENLQVSEIFNEKIEKFYLDSIVKRIKEYCTALENNRENDL